MTYLARIPQRCGTGSRHVSNESFIPSLRVRAKAAVWYTARLQLSVTKPRDNGGYSPYLPAAGLYSLFSDSFGPVPYAKFGDGV